MFRVFLSALLAVALAATTAFSQASYRFDSTSGDMIFVPYGTPGQVTYASLDQAINSTPLSDRSIRIVGAHTLSGTATFAGDNVVVKMDPTTVLTSTGAGIAALHFTGSNCQVTGGKVITSTFTNSQALVLFRGQQFTSDALTFLASDDSINSATNLLPIFPVGVYIRISGAATAGNNTTALVVASTAAKLTTNATITDDASAGETIIITQQINDSRIDDVTFEVNTTPAANPVSPPALVGSTSTPMVCVEFNTANRYRVRGCTFLPNHAVTPIKSTNGTGADISNNQIGPKQYVGLGQANLNQLTLVRLCYRAIDLTDDEWGGVMNNRIYGLGDFTGLLWAGGQQLVDSGIRYRSTTAITSNEHGHMNFGLNRIELVVSTGCVRMLGGNSLNIYGNLIGFNGGVCNENGEAGIVITGSDGATGAPLAQGVNMFANDVHNCAAEDTDGAQIFAIGSTELVIGGNALNVCFSNNAIRIGAASVGRAHISNNSFRGATAATAITLVGAANIADGIYVGNNSYEGFTAFLLDESNAGAAGRRKILTGVQDIVTGNDASFGITRVNTLTFDTATDILSDTGTGVFAGFAVGDFVAIGGSSTATNNVVTRVVSVAAGPPSTLGCNFNMTTDATADETVTVRKLALAATTNAQIDQP